MQFSGIIPEIPYIRVDNFIKLTDQVHYGFISHAHSDHLSGLANSIGNLEIYCTEITKKLICSLEKSKYKKNLDKLRPCPMNKALTLGQGKIRVTFIPIYHCLGSAMILFETHDKNVLFTGDARFDMPTIFTLKMNQKLMKYTARHRMLGCHIS